MSEAEVAFSVARVFNPCREAIKLVERSNSSAAGHGLKTRATFLSAYTLIEMLTTVAALVLILGLMVSLARFVRFRSSTDLTEEILVRLDLSMQQYARLHGGQLPDIPPAVPDDDPSPTEGFILSKAHANNRAFLGVVRSVQPVTGGMFANLPISIYDGQTLKDAWGGLILFMPHQHPAIGIAPDNRFFFFSAGPDRRYLTRDDNLYSYEGR